MHLSENLRRLTPAVLFVSLLAGCATGQAGAPSVPQPQTTPTSTPAAQPQPPIVPGETGPPGEASDSADKEGTAEGETATDGSEGSAEAAGEESSLEDSMSGTSGAEGDSPDSSSTNPSSGDGTEQAAAGATASTPAPPISGPATSGERTTKLDGELEKSLAEFDGMLLSEQQVLEEKRSESADESAGGSAGGGAGEIGGGKALPAEGTPSAEEAGADRSGGGGAGASQPEGEEEPLDEEMASRVPSDVGDGSDDDIVARQLREAAMKEEDPELREKLWDEYRRYKNGGKG